MGFKKSHVWLKYNHQSQKGRFGITNFAQKSIGDIQKVEIPSIGDKFDNNEVLGKLESTYNKFIIYSPLSLKINKINIDLYEDPTLINQNADSCWIAEGVLLDDEELNELMTEEEYIQFLKDEEMILDEEEG